MQHKSHTLFRWAPVQHWEFSIGEHPWSPKYQNLMMPGEWLLAVAAAGSSFCNPYFTLAFLMSDCAAAVPRYKRHVKVLKVNWTMVSTVFGMRVLSPADPSKKRVMRMHRTGDELLECASAVEADCPPDFRTLLRGSSCFVTREEPVYQLPTSITVFTCSVFFLKQ